MDPPPLPRGLIALTAWLVLVWSATGLAIAWRRAVAARRLRRRADRARTLELDARRLLEHEGYRVVEAQVTRELEVEVDGERLAYDVRADYLVEACDGALLVAEVKSGELATDPLQVATRRQLLEYQVGFGAAEGVLLVDMERGVVRRVRFAE